MEQEKVLLTQSGLEKLEQERDNLINVERPKVIEELQLARSQGDLSENADYDAAREKLAHILGLSSPWMYFFWRPCCAFGFLSSAIYHQKTVAHRS